MTRRRLLILAIATAAVIAAGALTVRFLHRHGDSAQASTSPLDQQAYVWQRAWTPAVCDAVRGNAGSFGAIVVLAAQVDFHAGRPAVTTVEVDYASLRASTKPVGLAIRIGSFGGPFEPDDEIAGRLCELAASVLQTARNAGLNPCELQIDFDCAQSKLEGYRVWLSAIKRAAGAVHVTFTALPSWLKAAGWRPLAKAADGFVLQVHSLQAPRQGKDMLLCDPKLAIRWVQEAQQAGKPFRVALPTYGYVAAHDASGRLIGLSAEGPAVDWPASAHLQTVRADPAAMANLVRQWSQSHPALMTGIIWYRLPTADDQLNWSAVTLRTVMAGQTPVAHLNASAVRTEPCLYEIELSSDGHADAPLPPCVTAQFDGVKVAADGIGQYQAVDTNQPGAVKYTRRGGSLGLLPPGRRLRIGWLRLDQDKEVTVHVLQE